MTIVFLFPYPLGESPSQRFRFEQYFHLLKTQSIPYKCYSFWSERTWRILYLPGKRLDKLIGFMEGCCRRLYALAEVSKADFVFIHRECLPVGPPIFEWMIARVLRKKIIYDFDDAIWLTNTSSENKIATLLKWHGKVKSICRWSYKVSCGNAFLAEFARSFNKNVIVNPTTIDTAHLHNPARYHLKKVTSTVTIGWTGSHSTLKYLKIIEPVLQKIEHENQEVRVIVIADKKPSLSLRTLQFIPWKKEREIEDLLQIDIGVMPLHDDIWSKGKCGFKALQYMALKIPALVSPVGVNTQIIDHNVNGFLCSTEEEWYSYLKKMIEDSSLRKLFGANGRKKIIERYSVTSNSPAFLSLFQ